MLKDREIQELFQALDDELELRAMIESDLEKDLDVLSKAELCLEWSYSKLLCDNILKLIY